MIIHAFIWFKPILINRSISMITSMLHLSGYENEFSLHQILFCLVSFQRIRDALLLTAQYPLATTINDFWSMIYDQHVSIIAVLLRPDELQSIVRRFLFFNWNDFSPQLWFRMFIRRKLEKNWNSPYWLSLSSVRKVLLHWQTIEFSVYIMLKYDLPNSKNLDLSYSFQTNQSRTVVWLEHLGWPPK